MRVVIADDHVLLRAGLAELLTSHDVDVVAQVGTAADLLAVVEAELPDVAVVDIRMPPDHRVEGLLAAREIRERHGGRVGVLVLSHHVETRHAVDLLADRSGGVGYLLKDRVLDPLELVQALERIHAGGTAIDPTVVERLIRRGHDRGPLEDLSPRELEILAAMAEGHSNAGIARTFHLSEKTVEANIGRIFRKLDLTDDASQNRRVAAVLSYLSTLGPSPPR